MHILIKLTVRNYKKYIKSKNGRKKVLLKSTHIHTYLISAK